MNLADLRVLLVEPSATQRHILEAQLGEIGVWRIQTARDADDALRQLDDDPADLVLSAMHLGADSSGAELIERMRARSSTASVPFVLLSSEQGSVWLEPVRQSGVSAIVRKPCMPADLERALQRALDVLDAEPPAGDGRELEAAHVLVVDDSKAARRFMITVLRRLGITRFAEATDGAEAVTLMASSFFDLVVTDYNMPNMNGHELVEFIRNESTQRSVPVMMVTSESDETRLAAVHEAGVSALCDKPFETRAVRAMLRGMLGPSVA